MSRRRSLAVLAGSLLCLAAVLVAWAAWPSGGGRADLVVGPPPRPAATAPTAPTTTTTTATPATPPTTAPPAVEPVRVQIPALGVDAPVAAVGLEPDGDMEIPPAAEVGWYRLGPRPGAGGSAVLAGHIDFNGQRGAFFDLRSLALGAEVLVQGPDTTLRFVVTEREQVPKADVDLSRYFTHDGPARITLITCGGAFDRGAGRYQDNIIVTAVAVPPG